MIENTTEKISRDLWVAVADQQRADSNAALDDALTSLDGTDPTSGSSDHDLLNDLLKQRYATGIRKPDKAGEREEYIRGNVSKGIDLYAQHVLIRLYRRITTATATLHTQPDELYTYTFDSAATDDVPDAEAEAVAIAIDELEKLLEWHRNRGGAQQAKIRGDRLSVALGSGAVRLVWQQGHIGYQAHAPQVIYTGYTASITEGDDTRTPDYTNFEDAAVIVVNLGSIPGDGSTQSDNRWIAYFGRSEGNPLGRRVVYRANKWSDVPEPGADSIDEEYTVPEGSGLAHAGEIANPLTWLQEVKGVDAVPYEYPFVRYIGNDAGANAGCILPTNGLALYNDCLELDVAWSRVMSSAVESAKDTIVIENPNGTALPKTLDGVIQLGDQQKATKLGLVAANAWRSADVLANIQGTVAQAWNVPAHMVIHGNQGGDNANVSGYAIALKSQPLIDYRRERAALNESEVQKLFVLEREMIWAHDPDGVAKFPASATQAWFEGEWRPPVNKTEQLVDLGAAKELGLEDQVSMMREYHDLTTDQDAKDLIDKFNERAIEYPTTATPQPQQPGGNLRSFGGPPPRPARAQQQQQQGENNE